MSFAVVLGESRLSAVIDDPRATHSSAAPATDATPLSIDATITRFAYV